MFNELKQSVSATLQKSSWLEEDSKEYALDRLSELFGIFGQPEMYFDPIFSFHLIVYDEKIFECSNCYILFPLLDFLLAPSTPTYPKVFSEIRSLFKSCMSD